MSNVSTEALPLRSAFAGVKGERLLSHNLILGAGTMAAGLLGVAFQSLVSHQLRPADYGGVFAVITLITLIGLPATSFTLLMAREASRDRANGRSGNGATLLRRGNRSLMIGGLMLAIGLSISSPILGPFLNVPAQLLVAGAAGIPFALALPLLLGKFQGDQRFVSLSFLLVCTAALKLLGALTLGRLLGPLGIIAGISLGTAVVYVIALGMLPRNVPNDPASSWLRPALAYLSVIVPSTLALGVLLSADVLLVKHVFPSRLAGEYAAVAALGRAIFWGATGVAGVLFPKAVFRETQGRRSAPVVGASLALVAAGGIGGLIVLSFASNWLLTAFAGAAYSEAAIYLPWYAVGMTLLGASAVLITTQQSRGRPAFLAILLPLSFLEPALLVAFHQNLTQVVQVLDISMVLIASGLAIQFVLQQRSETSALKSIERDLVAPPSLGR
jgi:O-antigen/teichoic acid export membrane protein